MNQFVQNPNDFSAVCGFQDGQCDVVRENILFMDDGEEIAAVDQLQRKCGSVVIIPDLAREGKALLYHTSCQRMTDVAKQIFRDCLEAPVSLPQFASEMTLGELHRRRLAIPYEDCRARVDRFDFQTGPQE